MYTKQPFSTMIYADEMHMEERELSAFMNEVTQLFGPKQAKISEEDWLEEAELVDSPPRSISRNWHAVTIAASARLANRQLCTQLNDTESDVSSGILIE